MRCQPKFDSSTVSLRCSCRAQHYRTRWPTQPSFVLVHGVANRTFARSPSSQRPPRSKQGKQTDFSHQPSLPLSRPCRAQWSVAYLAARWSCHTSWRTQSVAISILRHESGQRRAFRFPCTAPRRACSVATDACLPRKSELDPKKNVVPPMAKMIPNSSTEEIQIQDTAIVNTFPYTPNKSNRGNKEERKISALLPSVKMCDHCVKEMESRTLTQQ